MKKETGFFNTLMVVSLVCMVGILAINMPVFLAEAQTPTPVPCTANLISNPCLEDSDGTNPIDWFRGFPWGNNIVNYTYPVAGETGNGARVDVTSYCAGDEKWYFKDVPVIPNQNYQYADSYLSDSHSKVVVRYTMNDGSIIYEDYGYMAPTGGVWQPFTFIFKAIENAVSLTMFHLLGQVGSLTIDSVSLSETDLDAMLLPTPIPTPVLVISCPTPTPTPSPSTSPTPDDTTPPVSVFDDNRNHQTIIEAEPLPLILSGTSTDDLSGVQSAELRIFKMADDALVDGEEYGAFFESLSCIQHGPALSEEIISLTNLATVGGLNTTWSYQWMPTARGIYCVEAHATDVAGNEEHTAFGGPISILASLPTPTPTPVVPTPTPNPGCTSNCGGGGGGGGGGPASTSTPTPIPSLSVSGSSSSTSSPSTASAPEVLGATTTLPATSLPAADRILFSIFSAMLTAGVIMLMIGYRNALKKQ